MLQRGGNSAQDTDDVEEYTENGADCAPGLDIGHCPLLFLNSPGIVDIGLILATLTSATTPGIVHRSSVIIPHATSPPVEYCGTGG